MAKDHPDIQPVGELGGLIGSVADDAMRPGRSFRGPASRDGRSRPPVGAADGQFATGDLDAGPDGPDSPGTTLY